MLQTTEVLANRLPTVPRHPCDLVTVLEWESGRRPVVVAFDDTGHL